MHFRFKSLLRRSTHNLLNIIVQIFINGLLLRRGKKQTTLYFHLYINYWIKKIIIFYWTRWCVSSSFGTWASFLNCFMLLLPHLHNCWRKTKFNYKILCNYVVPAPGFIKRECAVKKIHYYTTIIRYYEQEWKLFVKWGILFSPWSWSFSGVHCSCFFVRFLEPGRIIIANF